MATLSTRAIARLLAPYFDSTPSAPVHSTLYEQLSVYLDMLLKWNARTNLTAIREPEKIVERHFGESLFAGRHLGPCETLLDFGSGAGFPGLPIQLLRPEIAVTLAESQNKKATFLREIVRTLGLSTEVWAGRVEAIPAERRFDAVTMRAVDDMEVARAAASARLAGGGQLLLMTTTGRSLGVGRTISLPNSESGILWLPMFHVERSPS